MMVVEVGRRLPLLLIQPLRHLVGNRKPPGEWRAVGVDGPEALQAPTVRQKLQDAGAAVPAPVADLRQFMVAETEKFRRIVDSAKVDAQ